MPEEETVETEVSKSSGKYLLKSKKAEIRPKKRRRPERKRPASRLMWPGWKET